MSRIVLDLCAGTGAATRAWERAGYRVVRVDVADTYGPDVLADVRRWTWAGERPAFVWASPPCEDFTRRALPWLRERHTGEPTEALAVVAACARLARELSPSLGWALENVRWSTRWIRPLLGPPRAVVGGRWVLWGERWGELPTVDVRKLAHKSSRTSSDRAARIAVPYAVSEAVYRAATAQRWLPGVAV